MTKKLIPVFVLLIIAGIAMVGYGLVVPGEETPASGAGESGFKDTNFEQKYVRYDDGQGGVQVTAVLLSPDYLKSTGREGTVDKYDFENQIVFEIAMSTHMGDLRKYPITEKADLLVNGEIIKPLGWKLTADDSHHPVGLLTFSIQDAKGTMDSKSDAMIELNLKELEGVSERKFTWGLSL